jgi:outer membrane biosynthesis protein TonB
MTLPISSDHPIWALTPTELLIAYLSLTKTKAEIADYVRIQEGTVGDHLTSIYAKLGLSENDDDVKRSLLDLRFRQVLDAIVQEIDEKYTSPNEKIKALRNIKTEAVKQKKKAPPERQQPKMSEPPPPARPRTEPRPNLGRRRIILITLVGGGLLVLIGVCVIGLIRPIALALIRTETPPTQTAPSRVITNTQQVVLTDTAIRTPTDLLVSTGTFTSEAPTLTATPEVLPTAIPLPIREDFSEKYSDLWWVSGNPIISENIAFGDYSGVLTTNQHETATLLIGNESWSDYVVSTRVRMPRTDNHLLIGVRVKDLNNMLALDCAYSTCSWVIFYEGEPENLSNTLSSMYFDPLTLTVEGDKITAFGRYRNFSRTYTMSFFIPPKYEGSFDGGGVMIQMTSVMEIDYIEINPLP